MKTLTTLTAAVLIFLSFSAFASKGLETERFKMDYTIQTYIDAICNGESTRFSDVIDNDARFVISRGNTIVNYTKSDMIGWMKFNKAVKQNCNTDFKLIEQTLDQAIVKVTMKYETFSRVNFVTVANTSNGWKITNVSSSFQ